MFFKKNHSFSLFKYKISDQLVNKIKKCPTEADTFFV